MSKAHGERKGRRAMKERAKQRRERVREIERVGMEGEREIDRETKDRETERDERRRVTSQRQLIDLHGRLCSITVKERIQERVSLSGGIQCVSPSLALTKTLVCYLGCLASSRPAPTQHHIP